MTALGQFIKRAFLSKSNADSDEFPITQGTYNDKTADIEMQYPYGYAANAPAGSLILLLNVMGQEENRVGFANYPQKRFRGLKEWEVKVGNFDKLQYIYFDENGNIVLNTPDKNIIIQSGKDIAVEAVGTISIKSIGNINLNTEGNITMNAPLGTIRLNAAHVQAHGTASFSEDVSGYGYTRLPEGVTLPYTLCEVPTPPLPCSDGEIPQPGGIDPGLPLIVSDLIE